MQKKGKTLFDLSIPTLTVSPLLAVPDPPGGEGERGVPGPHRHHGGSPQYTHQVLLPGERGQEPTETHREGSYSEEDLSKNHVKSISGFTFKSHTNY